LEILFAGPINFEENPMNIKDLNSEWVKDFIEISRRIPRRGLTFGGGGGISMRVSGGDKILIKGWEVASEDLDEKDISLLDWQGRQLNDVRPCLESPLHLETLKARKDIGAVVHAHPPYSTAFGNLWPDLRDEELRNYPFLKQTAAAPYADPGSADLARHVSEPFQKEGVFCVFMRDHGVTVVGADVYDAYYRLDFLEGTAKVFVLSALLKKAFK
jgi:L-fuculose-phosphate aldolase